MVDEKQNVVHVWRDREYPIAEVRGNWTDQLLPTANLIAAAPELLAELKRAHEIITDLWALGMKHNIPDGEWPMLRQDIQHRTILEAEGKG